MGCPNLPASPDDFNYKWKEGESFENNQDTRGCIFVASKGGGCYQLPFIPGAPAKKLHVTPNDGSTIQPSEARFCVGVEKFSDALGQVAAIAKVLHGEQGLTADGDIVKAQRIDSQAKFGVLARGGAEYYARLPKPGYREWIWDHAAGNVVITEAGGVMSDTDGDTIDFSLGAKMSGKVKGVLGSNGGIFHKALVDAFQRQEAERLKKLEKEKVYKVQ
jgi:3'-phosphoadenosine 5'-phosphosulfate (PAPS) 3'-phosphatase